MAVTSSLKEQEKPKPRNKPGVQPYATPVRGPGLPVRAGCACGGTCPRCRALAEKQGAGVSGEPLEREADRLAEGMLGGMDMPFRGGITPAAGDPSAAAHRPTTTGQPLDAAQRAFYEARLGLGLGQVRLHVGPSAARQADALSARAYAVGDDIVFNAGQYAPASQVGRHLLGHELAHVAQQARGGPVVQRQPLPPGECDPANLGTLGPLFHRDEPDVAAMGYSTRTVSTTPTSAGDFVLYCPHRSTRPLKRLVPCTTAYWVGDAEAAGKGRGKDEVWARQEGESGLFWGYVKKTFLSSAPCAAPGENAAGKGSGTGTGQSGNPAPGTGGTAPAASAARPEPTFSYGHKANCPQSFLESHVWPGTYKAAKMISHTLDAVCAANSGNPTKRNKEAVIQMKVVFGPDWKTKASDVYLNLHRLVSAVGGRYTYDCISGYEDGPSIEWMNTWTRTALTGGPGGDMNVYHENFVGHGKDVDFFASTLIHELGHRFLGLEHGADEESMTCAGEVDDAHCYAILAEEMWKNVQPGYGGSMTDLCLSGGTGKVVDPANWD